MTSNPDDDDDDDANEIIDATQAKFASAEEDVDRAFSTLQGLDRNPPGKLAAQALLMGVSLSLRVARHRVTKEGGAE